MRLTLRLDGSYVRNWHLQLVERLRALPGVTVAVALAAGGEPLHGGVEALFQLEALIHRLSRTGPAALLPRSALDPFLRSDLAEADLTIDLAGDATADNGRLWRLTFDGVTGEAALLAALLEGDTPLVAIVEGERAVAAGRLGTEYGGVLLASFEDILARISTLIVAALSGAGSDRLPSLPEDALPTPAARPLDAAGSQRSLPGRSQARWRAACIICAATLRIGARAGASSTGRSVRSAPAPRYGLGRPAR